MTSRMLIEKKKERKTKLKKNLDHDRKKTELPSDGGS